MSLNKHELVVLRAIHDWNNPAFRADLQQVPDSLVDGIIARLRSNGLIRQDAGGTYLATEDGLKYVYPPKNVVRVKIRKKS